LLYGGTDRSLTQFQDRVAAARRLPLPLKDLLQALPKWTPPLDALRSAVSVLAHFDQDMADNSHDANLRKAERLLAQLPVAVADHFRFSKGLQAIPARPDLPHAANFLYMLRGGEAPREEVRAFDVSLILYAEHEFNASTFAARTIVSTLSDLHSAVCGAIGALKGALHGGANEKVMDVVRASGGVATAEKWTKDAAARRNAWASVIASTRRGRACGNLENVRSRCERRHARMEDTADAIENVMAAEKKMYPNLDWPAGRLYHALGLEIPIYTPIFAISRVAGWSAHVIEQLDNNRLIRPRSLYTGPDTRTVKPIGER
jgi:citrate synthase